MSATMATACSVGIDFGTTNSVVARTAENGQIDLIDFAAPDGLDSAFRSALCFWEDDAVRGGLAHEAGPWAISEFLDVPQGSRFLRLRFEELGQVFLTHLLAHAGRQLHNLPDRVIVGRPVRYVGSRPDPELARARYDAMFAVLGRPVHYVYEPLGAAYGFASRLSDPANLLVADFGGGTSDFSIVRVEAPGAARRCVPLGSAGIGIAGDRFDFRIMDHLVLPLLGKGGTYRSFGKVLDIPDGHFADFGDWSRLALMRNRRTLDRLTRLQQSASDPATIGRMIAVVEHELGYGLYEAVGRLKRTLSSATEGEFRFQGADLMIEAEVSRSDFEGWIEQDLARIGDTIDAALAKSGLRADQIDHVFLTGGSSLIPAVRRMFEQRFGSSRIASGNEFTSIAHGLAQLGNADDLLEWTT